MKKTALFPPIFFFLFSLVITAPLYLPGYVLTLDTVVTPKVAPPIFQEPGLLLSSLNYAFSRFFPTFLFPKIVLTISLFLAGWGLYRLSGVRNIPAALFAGLLYSVNPFVYERVMAGQWSLVLAYGLFPFVISGTSAFFDKPSVLNAVFLGLLIGLTIEIYLHYSLILAAFLVLYAFFRFLLRDKNFRFLKNLSLALFVVFLINAHWLLPSVFSQTRVSQALSSFSTNDLIAFQSVPDGVFGLVFNLLSGYGFWAEVHDYFISVKEIMPLWPLLSVTIIAFALYGFFKMLSARKKELPLIMTLAVLFFIGLDLSGGIALKPFADTTISLYENIPLLRGFREPQKLVSLLLLSYSFFGAYTVSFILSKIKPRLVQVFAGLLIAFVPLVYTPTVFGGFFMQLAPVQYPQGWFLINRILNEDKDDFLVLVFPWHQYMKFNFNNGRVVANPAPYFFDKPILSSRNYETRSLYSHDSRPEALHVEGLLSIEEKGENLFGQKVNAKVDWAADLSPIGTKYIILAKESDWKKYSFLNLSPSLVNIFEDGDIVLYKNEAFPGSLN